MTDVPFGRGGSPLQNLIARGIRETRLTALRMTAEVDAGPVYRKEILPLSGAAHEIYARAADLSLKMIEWIVREEPPSVPQSGAPTYFARRTPAESVLPNASSLEAVYDHIRMLDAEGYPPAFIEHGEWRMEFSNGMLREDCVEARVCITRRREAR
jgi:methionyl-tRNA formyltransferase